MGADYKSAISDWRNLRFGFLVTKKVVLEVKVFGLVKLMDRV